MEGILNAAPKSAGPAAGPKVKGEEGQVTAFVAVITAALVLLAGLVIDGGLALAGHVRTIDEAAEAARAGAQQLDLEEYRQTGRHELQPDQAEAAAREYIAAVGDHGTVHATRRTVEVHVVHRQAAQILRIAGISAFNARGSAVAHAERGVDRPINQVTGVRG